MELIILFQTGGDRMKTLRVEKLCKKMREHGIDQVIVTSKANVYYFTGAYLDPMRRLLALIINSDGSSVYYVNRLFHIDPCVQTELVFWDDTQDPTKRRFRLDNFCFIISYLLVNFLIYHTIKGRFCELWFSPKFPHFPF